MLSATLEPLRFVYLFKSPREFLKLLCQIIYNRLAPSWLRRGRVFRRMSLVDTTPSAPPPHTQPRGGAFLATTATRHHRQLGPKSETWDRVSGLGPCPDGSLWAEGHPESPRRSRRKPLDVDVSLRASRRS